MLITAKQAAKVTGKSKATILRACKSGRISAVKDEVTGAFMMDPAELDRAFPGVSMQQEKPQIDSATEAAVLRRELEILTDERERERKQYEAQLADLRRVLAVITDQRAGIEAIPMPGPTNGTDRQHSQQQPERKSLWQRWRGR